MSRELRDGQGRELRYLRLSVTDRCNFRCVYCLPRGCAGGDARTPLSRDEIRRLVSALAGAGVWKVRLTGGEPTLRRDICEVVREVARAPGVRRVGLTTNGYRLAEIASELRDAGLTALNVSVDSLDPERFERITGVARLGHVVAGVEAALSLGLAVKVNAVLLPGTDERELGRFLGWIRDTPLTVRFIELMETASNGELFRSARRPAASLREQLERHGWTALPREPGDGPATSFCHPDYVGRTGIISASSSGFCAACNRIRVSCVGDLRPCLFGEDAVPLRPLLQDDGAAAALVERVVAAVRAKPPAHALGAGRRSATASLAMTGG